MLCSRSVFIQLFKFSYEYLIHLFYWHIMLSMSICWNHCIIFNKSCTYVHVHTFFLCSKDDEVEISIPGVNRSTSPVCGTSPTQDDKIAEKTTTPSASKDDADISNESTPLVSTKKSSGHTLHGDSATDTDHEERITFADIPMPGLWEHDKPGRNTDRIIILLFVLLASMIVVSID